MAQEAGGTSPWEATDEGSSMTANPAPAPAVTPGSGSTEEKMLLLGEAAFLFLQSPPHLHYRMHQFAAHSLVPLRLNQFRIYRGPKGPVGFVAWAWLDDARSARYADGDTALAANDWRCGPHLWFVEFLAPFGHARRMVDDLRGGLFRREVARARRVRASDGRVQLMRWHGVDVPAAPAAAPRRTEAA